MRIETPGQPIPEQEGREAAVLRMRDCRYQLSLRAYAMYCYDNVPLQQPTFRVLLCRLCERLGGVCLLSGGGIGALQRRCSYARDQDDGLYMLRRLGHQSGDETVAGQDLLNDGFRCISPAKHKLTCPRQTYRPTPCPSTPPRKPWHPPTHTPSPTCPPPRATAPLNPRAHAPAPPPTSAAARRRRPSHPSWRRRPSALPSPRRARARAVRRRCSGCAAGRTRARRRRRRRRGSCTGRRSGRRGRRAAGAGTRATRRRRAGADDGRVSNGVRDDDARASAVRGRVSSVHCQDLRGGLGRPSPQSTAMEPGCVD